MNMKSFTLLLLIIAASATSLGAQTIAEKKAGLTQQTADLTPDMERFLSEVNQEHEAHVTELKALYAEAYELYKQNAPEYSYKDLLQKINTIKKQIVDLETEWQKVATEGQQEGYALWHQPDTTLEQLVVDYGSQDYVYILSPAIANIPISVTSNLPIPRTSWDEMLELILTENGVGVKQLNPFLRELYLLKEDRSKLALISNNRKDLAIFPSTERIAFVLTPEPSDVRRVWFFLEKFVNPNSVVMQMIGRDILIVAQVSEVQELLKLYDFVTSNRGQKEYKAVTLNRVNAEEMANILAAIFGGLIEDTQEKSSDTSRPSYRQPPPGATGAKGIVVRPSAQTQGPSTSAPSQGAAGDNGLRVIPLSKVARAVFLVGTREEIRKAENIIADVEDQVGESIGKVIFMYTTKHSDPEELADILQKIYWLISTSDTSDEYNSNNRSDIGVTTNQNISVKGSNGPQFPALPPPFANAYFLSPPIGDLGPVPPPPVNQNRDNFIVDLKTGAIVMVVEAHLLPKLKELISRIDVPKKMVRLEVLLFEKRLTRENDFGLNLLKIGSCASNTKFTCLEFNDVVNSPPGIFDFLLRRKKNDVMPAFDLAYRFLLTQDDLHINASPSVLAVNQTPAIIEIAEEISVNTGIFEIPTTGDVALKEAFARAQYGIKIEITPTIHLRGDDDDPDAIDYVDMITDITFQTIRSNVADRPDVTTRHIMNEVSIPNGQTVILGGLRERDSHDFSEKIPFLGELPGIGKLFSITNLEDETTEMFIFITPTIVYDPVCDLERIRDIEMNRRPGDIPPFMCRLVEAQQFEKNRLFAASMAIIFGRKPDRCVFYPDGEYDGR